MQILLIDLSGLAHMLWHVSGSDPDPDATSRKTVERVRALASGQPHVAICLDSGRSFRHDLDAAYKANRPAQVAALQHQIATAIDTLRADGFPCWAAKGMEADDVIASAVREAMMFGEPATMRPNIDGNLEASVSMPTATSGLCVTVVSSDKDLRALVGPRVTVRTFDGVVYDEAKVVEKHGVRPEQMIDYLSLVGDASDNIAGCKGIGEKTAARMLQKYGTLEAVFADLTAHGTNFTPATATNLREFEPRMAAVRALVTMRTDVPLPFEEVFRERVPADTAVFDGEDHDPMDETAPRVASETPGEPAGPEPAVSEAPRAAGAPIDPMAALAASTPPAATASAVGLAVREPEVLPPPSSVFEMQLEPRSLREAALLGQEMFKSRLFSAYGTPQGILSTILAGRELGMQAMASLRAFHLIDGKPTLSADLIRALVLKSGQAEYFRCTERTPERATFLTKRKGDPEVALTFTVAEGRTAFSGDEKAWTKSGWSKNPADMCVARASAKLARLVYADVVFNLYDPSEVAE